MSNKVDNRGLLAIGVIVAVIIIALTISFGIDKFGLNKMEKEAIEYTENEDYNSAISVYTRLESKSGKSKYKQKKKEMELLSEEYDNYTQGVKKIEDGQYIPAVKKFVKIDRKESIYYDKSRKELEKIENNIVDEAQKSIDEGNTYLATSILNDYLRVVGPNEKLENLVKLASGEVLTTEPTEKNEKDKDKDKDKKKDKSDITDDLPEDVNNWVGLTTTVKVDSAYIKNEPSLDAPAITSIGYGGTITIEKTHDDGGRIWCYGTITSAKTDESFQAWISSKMLMNK